MLEARRVLNTNLKHWEHGLSGPFSNIAPWFAGSECISGTCQLAVGRRLEDLVATSHVPARTIRYNFRTQLRGWQVCVVCGGVWCVVCGGGGGHHQPLTSVSAQAQTIGKWLIGLEFG